MAANLRTQFIDGEVYVPVQDMLLWFREAEERLAGRKPADPGWVLGRIADEWRDAWIDACRWEGNP